MFLCKIDKPWGYELILEKNKYYVLKKLYMKKKASCSLQYHKKKHETIYVLQGVLKILYGKNRNNLSEILLYRKDTFSIPSKMIHRMVGIKNCLYLEVSTPELKDVVRLSDNYGRCGV
jgi:mannose-6-phosphate isomerase-like protein (cupin superfamily)